MSSISSINRVVHQPLQQRRHQREGREQDHADDEDEDVAGQEVAVLANRASGMKGCGLVALWTRNR